MICDRVLANIGDMPEERADCRREDPLMLDWWEIHRRSLRKSTVGGIEIRVLLPSGQGILPGDVLLDDGQVRVVARVTEATVLVIRPADAAEMARVALELGNLHAPTQIVAEEIRVAPDGPTEAALRDLGVAFDAQVRRFVPCRCAGMPVVRVAPQFTVVKAAACV